MKIGKELIIRCHGSQFQGIYLEKNQKLPNRNLPVTQYKYTYKNKIEKSYQNYAKSMNIINLIDLCTCIIKVIMTMSNGTAHA